MNSKMIQVQQNRMKIIVDNFNSKLTEVEEKTAGATSKI